MNRQKTAVIILVLTFLMSLSYKIFILHYSPSRILPEKGFQVHINMAFEGHNNKIRITSVLPLSSIHQNIFNEQVDPADLDFTIKNRKLVKFGIWHKRRIKGSREIQYSFDVILKKMVYQLPEFIEKPETYPKKYQKYLSSSSLIQVGDSSIIRLIQKLDLEDETNLRTILEKVYQYVTHDIQNADFSGKTDAITTLKLQKASCNGKSRLFTAIMRTLGIPTRLVGGLILTPGEKKITHQWVEVFIQNHWIPFDPTNDHFAELPEHYLVFYYGDLPFFKRTSNIKFDFWFTIESKQYVLNSSMTELSNHPLNIMNAWPLFHRAGLSFELLRIILMIPVGALVVIIFRNVIGVRTFGTFLPVLIASAFRGSGLFWGLVTFLLIISLGSIIRFFLDKFKLVHTPKLTILLVFVVFSLLFISGAGVFFHNMKLAQATLYPIALTSITIERFSLLAEESGYRDALKILLNTILTIIFAYIVINSKILQTFVLAFPETMFLVIAGSIYLGNWIGLRVTELIRFRKLIFKEDV